MMIQRQWNRFIDYQICCPSSPLNRLNLGRRALFSNRTQNDVTEFSNCRTEERSEAV